MIYAYIYLVKDYARTCCVKLINITYINNILFIFKFNYVTDYNIISITVKMRNLNNRVFRKRRNIFLNVLIYYKNGFNVP